MRDQIQDVMDDRNQGYKDAAHPTVFKSLLDSDLPPQEKTIDRLQDEGVTLVGAGQETVRATLTIATYHILQNPAIMKRLKEELMAAFPDSADPPELSKFEQLPYLSACIQEGKSPESTSLTKLKYHANPNHSPPPLLRPHLPTGPPGFHTPKIWPLHHPRPHSHLAKPLLRAPRRGPLPRLPLFCPRALAQQSESPGTAHSSQHCRRQGRWERKAVVEVFSGVYERLEDVCRDASGACAAAYRVGECVSAV